MWGAGIWVSAVAAVVAGLEAIVRHHERSWMVVPATALGLLPVVLLVSEIALGEFRPCFTCAVRGGCDDHDEHTAGLQEMALAVRLIARRFNQGSKRSTVESRA